MLFLHLARLTFVVAASAGARQPKTSRAWACAALPVSPRSPGRLAGRRSRSSARALTRPGN